jgi:hypothetical protein
MRKTGALASALRSSGAIVPAADEPVPLVVVAAKVQPSRIGTKPITVHFPEPVRRQLKMLAAEQGRNMDDLTAEALNLLFARYRKPEIAPSKSTSLFAGKSTCQEAG